jgi:hypothetical protein
MRRMLAANEFVAPGDPAKIARAMIASLDRSPAPRRLTLGRDAYAQVRAVLVERLAALDAQKDIALSTDRRAN